MGDVLFLAHRIPFPPDRGDKIRSHHVLKAIAALAPVHVACFADDDADLRAEADLAALSATYCLVRRTKPVAVAGIEALAKGCPVSLAAFASAEIARFVAHTLATRPIDTIYVFSGQMGQFVPPGFKGRVVVDFVDVDSAKFDAYGKSGSGPMAWVNAREGRRLRAEEARLAARADASVLISAEEAALFASRLPTDIAAHANVRVLGNGIDASAFDPDRAQPAGAMIGSPRLIFTGQMDYPPNHAAAMRMVRSILPEVRRHLPDAAFHVVGRNPLPELRAFDGRDGVCVHGRVDDMRGWLAGADLAVIPLAIARGVQNKVLEAMAMALPVVLTPGAATGIGARDGEHFVIAETDQQLAHAIIDLAENPARAATMARRARRFVCEEMNWNTALAGLPELLGIKSRQGARHAA